MQFFRIAIAAAALLAAPAAAADFRVQIGGGYAFSALETEPVEIFDGALFGSSLDEVDAGSGTAFSAALWVDDLIAQDVSFGLEYIRSWLDPEVVVAVRVPGRTGRFALPGDAVTNTVFLNLAYRDGDGRFHPYGGIGIGGGTAKIDVKTSIFSGKIDSVQAGIQGFVGLDYDLNERFYIGGSARAYYVDARIIGEDIQFLELMLMGNVGVRF